MGEYASDITCVRCGLKPAVHEFICADCLYDDYNLASQKWDEWQALAEDAIERLQRGASDYGYTIELRKRRDALQGLPPNDAS